MKKTFVAVVTLSIIIVVTLLAGIACSSQSSSGELPADTSSDNPNLVVLTQTLTCVLPADISDIHVLSKNLKSGYEPGLLSGSVFLKYYQVGEIRNDGTGTATDYQVHANNHYADGSGGYDGVSKITIGPGQTISYNLSVYCRRSYKDSRGVNMPDDCPTSYDVYVTYGYGGIPDCKSHLTGQIKNKGPNMKYTWGITARFYDAQGVLLGQASDYFEPAWAGDIVNYDIEFSSKAQPVRYEIRIDT